MQPYGDASVNKVIRLNNHSAQHSAQDSAKHSAPPAAAIAGTATLGILAVFVSPRDLVSPQRRNDFFVSFTTPFRDLPLDGCRNALRTTLIRHRRCPRSTSLLPFCNVETSCQTACRHTAAFLSLFPTTVCHECFALVDVDRHPPCMVLQPIRAQWPPR
jgi:hypothetical protein